MTERLHFHFSLSCIGEGNGNQLHCSCLENPRDGGAWWAAVYGVSQSRTRLKRLSSSGSSKITQVDFFFFFSFIYLLLSALGLHCCTQVFSSCGQWGLLFLVVCRLLILMTSLDVEVLGHMDFGS